MDMNPKKSRIAAFLDTLPSIDISEEAQSTLLKSGMEFVGGSAKNGGDCTNTDRDTCQKSKNCGACKNSQYYCKDANNGGACGPVVNIPVTPPVGPPVVANSALTCPG